MRRRLRALMQPPEQEPSELFLDSAEQEELVSSFEEANRQAARTWRACFIVTSLCLCLFYSYSAHLQYKTPWQRKYHASFLGVLHPTNVARGDIAAAANMFVMMVAMVAGGAAMMWLLRLGLLMAVVLSLFYFNLIIRLPSDIQLGVLWMPILPPLYALLMIHINSTHSSTAHDLNNLRNAMYPHKKL